MRGFHPYATRETYVMYVTRATQGLATKVPTQGTQRTQRTQEVANDMAGIFHVICFASINQSINQFISSHTTEFTKPK